MDNQCIQKVYRMNTSSIYKIFAGMLCWMIPVVSQAWWHEDWEFRKELIVDTSVLSEVSDGVTDDVQVLVRLHVGNFSYFMDVKENGEDIRFIDGDDKTPLKFHIERFDPINQMALIWVRIPNAGGISGARPVWMYYGNQEAAAGADSGATYDIPHALVMHFANPQDIGHDATAYGNHAQVNGVGPAEGVIGAAASFNGSGIITVPAGRGLQGEAETGFTLSTWFKVDEIQSGSVIANWAGDSGSLSVRIVGEQVHIELAGDDGAMHQLESRTQIAIGSWNHLAVTGGDEGIILYINGVAEGELPVSIPSLGGDLILGTDNTTDGGLVGYLDEVNVASKAHSGAWIAFSHQAQASDSMLVQFGEDGQQEASGGHSAFSTILRNVTVDGWVVIVILAIMGVISWMVMFSKGLVINRIRRDNANFLQQFAKLGTSQVDRLDSDEAESDSDASSILTALSGRHKHFESSNIYQIYHAGVQEMHHRTPKAVGAQAATLTLSDQAINAIRATMDGVLIRQMQKLNSQIVLLTIAISGGPFLGLLGTVVGVMIVFAEIAAVGDVNVNAIAPGIAAALVATAAGVGVAIPALFGYNYLGSRIKEISADMHVFVDEFVAKIAEQHS
jgi:biopolymer transport protein ExbB